MGTEIRLSNGDTISSSMDPGDLGTLAAETLDGGWVEPACGEGHYADSFRVRSAHGRRVRFVCGNVSSRR